MAYSDKNQNNGSIVLIKPHVTERSSLFIGQNVYSFIVDRRATKFDVKKAVEDIYKVTPRKVNIVSVPAKKVFGRGRIGRRSGFKKAIVYLKEGDKIDII